MAEGPYDALLVVSFGGPEGQDEVIPFLQNVLRGRQVPAERMEVVAAHYRLFGGVSPINGQNRALLAALGDELQEAGLDLRLYWGNRNWHPLLTETVQQMVDDGIHRALAFVTSAYGSYSGCRQYLEDLARARAAVGPGAPPIDKLRLFYNHPGFIGPNARRLQDALDQAGDRAQVAFTAHSVPAAMVASSSYVHQLDQTARLVGERTDAGRQLPWRLVYQSRSGPPGQPWLEPDIGDHLRALSTAGVEEVVVAPIGFISDHMEVVYDLDVQARGVADDLGIRFIRAATAGTDPAFIAMIRQLVEERLDPSAPRLALGDDGPWPDHCPAGCCPAPTMVATRPSSLG